MQPPPVSSEVRGGRFPQQNKPKPKDEDGDGDDDDNAEEEEEEGKNIALPSACNCTVVSPNPVPAPEEEEEEEEGVDEDGVPLAAPAVDCRFFLFIFVACLLPFGPFGLDLLRWVRDDAPSGAFSNPPAY